jgi:hypothetical protein
MRDLYQVKSTRTGLRADQVFARQLARAEGIERLR